MTTENLQVAVENDFAVETQNYYTQEITRCQKRAKSLRNAFLQDYEKVAKSRLNSGMRVAMRARNSELDAVRSELDFYRNQLEDALECCRSLKEEIRQTPFSEMQQKLVRLLEYGNREVIPQISKNIQELQLAEKKILSRVADVKKTSSAARKHGRKLNPMTYKPYKRNRAIAREQRNAEKYAAFL